MNSRNAIGFMGDDHIPVTPGWDQKFQDVMDKNPYAIVYANDLLQGENLPTQVMITTNILRAIGYMCPPGFTHLWLDNVWLDWGRASQCLTYLPNVIIEHRHPLAEKATWDDTYEAGNNNCIAEHDRSAYNAYVTSGQLNNDVSKIVAAKSRA
jgi:hypothetical protein